MSNTNIEDLSREDLIRVVKRDLFVKEQLSARIASLVHENLELIAMIQETQEAQTSANPASNGELPTAPQAPEGVLS